MLRWKLAWSLVPVLITMGILMLTNLVYPLKPIYGLGVLWVGLVGLWFGITSQYHHLQRLEERLK
jgi:hypothetical protein